MPGRMGIMGEKFKTFISCTKEDNMKLLAFVIVLLAIIAFFFFLCHCVFFVKCRIFLYYIL